MEQNSPPQNSNQQTKVIYFLSGSLLTLFFIILYSWVNFSLLTNKTILPSFESTQNIPTSSQEVPTKNPTQPDNKMFDSGNINSTIPVLKNKKAYYLKNGDIWIADLATKQNNARVLLDISEDILTFDISNNQDLLAYSVKLNSSEDEFSWKFGDTIFIRDLKNLSEFKLYSGNSSVDMQIRSILFSTDDKQLFFSNNSIWVANLTTKKLQKYLTEKYNSFCSVYTLDDVSMDNQHILATRGCYEGSSQLVFNVRTKKTVGTFKNGYFYGGTSVHGFITNNLLFANEKEEKEETETSTARLGIYNLSGNLIKQIPEVNTSPLYFDNKSVTNKIFISLPSGNSTEQEPSVYELNTQTYTLNKTIPKEIVTVVYNGDTYSYWLTNTFLENPTLIDQNIKLEESEHLKLK